MDFVVSQIVLLFFAAIGFVELIILIAELLLSGKTKVKMLVLLHIDENDEEGVEGAIRNVSWALSDVKATADAPRIVLVTENKELENIAEKCTEFADVVVCHEENLAETIQNEYLHIKNHVII